MTDRLSPSTAIPVRRATPDVESQDVEESTPWELRTGRGGPNSIDNFARSWQRAASFLSPIPKRPSFIYEHTPDRDADEDSGEATPLLRTVSPRFGGTSTFERPAPTEDEDAAISGASVDSLFRKQSNQSVADFATSYGSRLSVISEVARQRAIELHREQVSATTTALAAADQQALTVKNVEREDGTKQTVIVGHSTVPQTVFNSVNVLIGIGMLSLPLAFQYSGWLIGLLLMVYSAGATMYTAKILAKCMDVDSTLATYADLAYVSYGSHGRLVVSVLFCFELLGACVAAVVLFADSVDALVPNYGVTVWKIVCGAVLIPLSFVPLHLLSLSSILGIFCCTSLLGILVIDGFWKPDAPGSLLQPAHTSLLPSNWNTVPLSIGLMLAPWGGHGVFPNIYKDMRHPHKYKKSLVYTYSFTLSLDTMMGIVGWLMFGVAVRDEVTSNILLGSGYPQALSLAIVALIAIVPLTKVPLNCRPMVATVLTLAGLVPKPDGSHALSAKTLNTCVGIVRVFVVLFFTAIAIVFPSFDRIMALMGASLCMIICIILPIAFHLKIFGAELGTKEWLANWFLLVAGTVMGAVGTAFAFIPKEELGIH